jgi:hypothetical protein
MARGCLLVILVGSLMHPCSTDRPDNVWSVGERLSAPDRWSTLAEFWC